MDYEKFASTLKKIKIKVLFTKDKSNPNGVTDTICAYFTYMDSVDRSVNTGPSSIATVTNSLEALRSGSSVRTKKVADALGITIEKLLGE